MTSTLSSVLPPSTMMYSRSVIPCESTESMVSWRNRPWLYDGVMTVSVGGMGPQARLRATRTRVSATDCRARSHAARSKRGSYER